MGAVREAQKPTEGASNGQKQKNLKTKYCVNPKYEINICESVLLQVIQ